MTLADRLRARIAADGPIGVDAYVEAANAHYYASRDPFGAEGDFVTAPEVSQMFGELIGLWCADLWQRAGRPSAVRYVELGPGRGTLAADALRAMRGAGLEPPVHLVETSPVLRAAQRDRLPAARWHDAIDDVPDGGPLLIVANEFFDALPFGQWRHDGGLWRALQVEADGAGFRRIAGPVTPPPAFAPPVSRDGAVVEDSAAVRAIAASLAARVAAGGGAALFIDYGHERHATGDTLQAVSRHEQADPWADPGERDLTFHVDFETLAEVGRAGGARVHGPVGQGAFLRALGLDIRAASLAKAAPERTEEIVAARERLSNPQHMGSLFKAIAFVGPGWPEPEGF